MQNSDYEYRLQRHADLGPILALQLINCVILGQYLTSEGYCGKITLKYCVGSFSTYHKPVP